MGHPLESLKARLREIVDLNMAAAVLGWDQRICMPPAGGEARARQLGTLAKLAHDLLVAKETQDLLAAAETARGDRASDSDDLALLRLVRRDLDKATKVPSDLVVALTETATLAEEHWVVARRENKYAEFAPWLTKTLDLKRQYTQAIGYQKRMYDALLDDYEEGMTADVLDGVFAELKKHTVPLVAAIVENADRVSDEVLTRPCAEKAQEAFSTHILKECGYDFNRGRLDRTVHPFCTNFSINDVRITTRYEEKWLPGALFGCLHEMGHALYEMGVNPAYEGTWLAGGVSMGVHESQSRLWENLVGRSRGFWERYYPELRKAFPGTFDDVEFETFYRAINKVSPSLIRVEADEVTYNLHIILRYEMENELLEGRLSVADAPAAWNARMKQYLGLTPPTDAEGVLQDVHWGMGGIGYFPTYTLGNILSVQFYEAAVAAAPGIPGQVREGRFDGLRTWLGDHVHRFGKKLPPADLVKQATGKAMTAEPYVRYLKTKFGEIYGVKG